MLCSRIAILFIFFALLLSACSLSSSRDDNSEATLPTQGQNGIPNNPILVVDDDEATEEAVLRATSTPRPTATSSNTSGGNTNGGNTNGGNTSGGNNNSGNPACFVRTDWPVYVVVSGDTLSSIARRVNSTVNQLSAANCINDPSRISVGQSLRVPQQPTSANQQAGTVVPSVVLIVNSGVRSIPVNQTILLSWQGVSLTGLSRAEFIYYPANTTNGTLLGTDTNLSDGAAINWLVPANINGTIIARAQNSSGGVTYSFDLWVVSTQNPNTTVGYVSISPANTSNGFDYTFNEGDTITLLWTQLPVANVTRVEFYMVIAAPGSPAPTLIGSDNNVSNGVSATTTLTSRMSGRVTAIAYRTNGSNVVTEREINIYTSPVDGGLVRGGNVTVFPAPRTQNGVALLEEGSQVTLSWQNLPDPGILQVEFVYAAGGGNTNPQSIGIDTNMADGVGITWTVPAGASGRLFATGRIPGQTHTGAISNDYMFNSVPPTSDGGTTTTVQAAYQAFENGFMLWRATPDGIYSLQSNGFVNYFSQSVYSALPENPVTDAPPPNRFKPVQGFGRVWGNIEAERTALGWGLAAEQSYTMTITRFEGSGGPGGGGYMIVTLPDGRRVTIRDNGSWEYTD